MENKKLEPETRKIRQLLLGFNVRNNKNGILKAVNVLWPRQEKKGGGMVFIR